MNRVLILHCGPMKTGSTAIQDLLLEQRPKLLEQSISYYHVRAKHMEQQWSRIVEDEKYSNSRVILLSSEFFPQVNINFLQALINQFESFEKHAIFTARRLRDIYPSLFLQNLKGSSMRTTSFQDFLQNQFVLDGNPDCGRVGQVMNFGFLDSRLSRLGCTTHWLGYSRKYLLDDFVDLLAVVSDSPLQSIDRSILCPPIEISPRRSLRMEVAGLARFVNVLTKRNLITLNYRKLILIRLLALSDVLRRIRPQVSALSGNTARQCDLFDRKINQPFLKHKGLNMLQS